MSNQSLGFRPAMKRAISSFKEAGGLALAFLCTYKYETSELETKEQQTHRLRSSFKFLFSFLVEVCNYFVMRRLFSLWWWKMMTSLISNPFTLDDKTRHLSERNQPSYFYRFVFLFLRFFRVFEVLEELSLAFASIYTL